MGESPGGKRGPTAKCSRTMISKYRSSASQEVIRQVRMPGGLYGSIRGSWTYLDTKRKSKESGSRDGLIESTIKKLSKQLGIRLGKLKSR